MKYVTIIKRYDREFRLPLYNLLSEKLQKDNIQLELIIGQPNKFEKINIKDALITNPYGALVKNHYLYLGKRTLSFQNIDGLINKSNLIILQQSNSELLNYLLIIKSYLRNHFKVGLWGHGINFQAKNKKSISQKFKLFYSKYADHWFAYNRLTYEILIKHGYPSEKITILNNTIDVTEEKKLFDSLQESEVLKIKNLYHIEKTDKTGLFCGSLYSLKRIDLMLKSLEIIKQNYSHFHFFVLGNGELEFEIKKFELENSEWFHFVGFKTGREKQIFFKIADFQLMPGAVGLNIVDSFYSQTPLVTTNDPNHGPEIDYLENNKNGLITQANIEDYANGVLKLLNDDEKMNQLKSGCEKSAQIYTIENMAENFYQGIIKVLGDS